MKKVALILFANFHVILIYAQMGQSYSCERINSFLRTTTLVVLDDFDSEYNKVVTEVIDSLWHITPVKFIKFAELNTYHGKDEYSMLVKNGAIRSVHRPGGRVSTIKNNELALYFCDQGPLVNYLANDAMAMVRVSSIKETDNYLYKLHTLIQTMQNYLGYVKEKQVNRNNYDRFAKAYKTENLPLLKYYNLMINADEMPDNLNLAKAEKAYGFSVEYASKEKIAEAIREKRKGTAILHLHPRLREYYIIGVEEGKVLYSAKTLDYGKLAVKDFGNIQKAYSEYQRQKGT